LVVAKEVVVKVVVEKQKEVVEAKGPGP